MVRTITGASRLPSITSITFLPCRVPGDAYYTFRPGDENCLPDNVNCDGNLWYRGKVDTSEVILLFFFDNSNILTSFLACDIFELEHVDIMSLS